MVNLTYHTTVRGETPKFITCEECGTRFGYWMERTGTGSFMAIFGIGLGSFGRGQSQASAKHELARRLDNEVGAASYPKCGHIQDDMLNQAREDKNRWIGKAGWIALPVVLILYCGIWPRMSAWLFHALGMDRPGAPNLLWTFGTLMLLIVLLLTPLWFTLIKNLIKKTYDPNSEDVEQRIRRGHKLVMGKKEHARLAGEPMESGLGHKTRMEDM